MIRRYAQMKPQDFERKWLAILPIGALEWHGAHLPLGTDGILAEGFARDLAERTGGILLPCAWVPVTTLPHRYSQPVRADTFRMWIDDVLAGLCVSGATRVAVVTGHYAQAHEIELYEAALRMMEEFPGRLVFAATPLETLHRDALLDHAGRWETAQMLRLEPSLVDLSALPTELAAHRDGVLGEDPRRASQAEGEAIWEDALAAWQSWLESDNEELRGWYGRAFDRYQPYVDAYYEGSWEDAIQKWWEQKGP